MEREREDHYRVLRERAARDPEAAREFVEVATGRLQDLRQGAKTFRRKASRDPVAGLVATDLEQEIQRVENDLRCVRRPAG